MAMVGVPHVSCQAAPAPTHGPTHPEMLLKDTSTGCYDPPPFAEFSVTNHLLRWKFNLSVIFH